MSYIIGISAFYHDSSCCLLKAGQIVAAASEERFSRIKHDHSLPVQSFLFCLKEANIQINDISCLAYYEDPHEKKRRQSWMLKNAPKGKKNDYLASISFDPISEIREKLGYTGPIECVSHHYSHAASAFYFSGFSEAAIFVADGVGEWATTSYGYGEREEIKLFEEVRFPHSLGLFYSTITSYLGFDVNDGEYKLMGLAPYGTPKYIAQLKKLITVKSEGQYTLDLKYFEFIEGKRMYSEALSLLLDHPPRIPESKLTPFACDLASSAQFLLEEILLEKTNYLQKYTGSENLCMAGGVALNCVANARINKHGPFKKQFVQPAANDAGGALGAAIFVSAKESKPPKKNVALPHMYWGSAYSNDEIKGLLNGCIKYRAYNNGDPAFYRKIASQLAEGKVIAWFQGRMEFGPRALGARSILADPRKSNLRDRVNETVKKRESFRPFAPVVLENRSKEHFDLDHPSPFMTETCRVVSDIDLPAITHVDGTARIQTVNSSTNPRFTALIEEFDRQTGCPILLNTSFNLRGEPIVESPIDALICFTRSKIDYLVLESILISRIDIPDGWSRWLDSQCTAQTENSISPEVYTLF